MSAIIAWITGKIAGPVFAVTALVLTIVCAVLLIQIHGWPVFGGGLIANNATLSDRINNPQTGYIRQLAQATTNTETALNGIESQNKALEAAKTAADKRAADFEAKWNLSRAAAQRANQTVGRIQAMTGDLTACPDVGRIILGGLQ